MRNIDEIRSFVIPSGQLWRKFSPCVLSKQASWKLAPHQIISGPMKKIISTNDAPAAVGPYSQAVRAGGMVFCAGQIPLDPKTGQIVSQDISEQTRRVLDNIMAVLKAEELTFENIVKTTIFLTDLADFQTVNEIYASYFKQQPPARSTVQVAGLPKNARVEIEAIAIADASAPRSGQSAEDTSG
jgi:2-iminobutanoate/2-iminopropanoate deaminase